MQKFVGPSLCCDAPKCDSCGKEVSHSVESLKEYQNRKLAEILKPLYTKTLIEQP
jgi:hypothetical protein